MIVELLIGIIILFFKDLAPKWWRRSFGIDGIYDTGAVIQEEDLVVRVVNRWYRSGWRRDHLCIRVLLDRSQRLELLLRLNKTLLKEVLLIRVQRGSATVVVVAADRVGRPTRCTVIGRGTFEGSIIKHLASLTCPIKIWSCSGCDLGILGLRKRKSRLRLSRGFQREWINLLNLN